MPLPSWCVDSVTVSRASLTALRGATERDWAHSTEHEVGGCSLQPTATATDLSQPRAATSVDAVLFAPAGSDIEEGDRVEFDGSTYSVMGVPTSRKSPFATLDHMRVELSLWEG